MKPENVAMFRDCFRRRVSQNPMVIRKCFLLIWLAALGGAISLPAAVFHEFYVSPTGSDANPGTKSMPFLTLAYARDTARALNRDMQGDIIVNVRGGTYTLKAPLEFGPADSGTNGFKVIYRAYGDEIPVINGGVQVTDWQPDHDRIFSANLDSDSKLRNLFVNGTRATMAQAEFKGQGAWGEFVVKGNEPWAETPGKTLDGIKFDAADVPQLTNAGDVELLQHRTWNFLVLCARDVTTEGSNTVIKLQQPYGAIAATMAWGCNLNPSSKFTIRNAYEFLNRPGQFYFNRVTHTLYYYAREGEDMSKAVVIAPLSQGLLRISGTATNNRVKNLVFTGLTFSYDHWLLESVGGSRGMVGVQSLGLYTRFRDDGNWHKSHYDICDVPQATVEVRNADNIRFERNKFLHLSSGCAVDLVNDVVDSTVEGNVFNDISGNAVNVGHPQHYVIGDGPIYPRRVEGVCARDRIANNFIRKVSLDYKQGEAISGFFTEAVEIAHNDISGVPYGGIALGWWWGNAGIPASTVPKNNVIVGNKVFDTQEELSKDGGAIYVLGEQPGGRIEGNYVRSLSRLMYPDDGSSGWTITNNVFDPQPGGKWLFVWTDRIHDLKIEDNFITGTNLTCKATNNCTPVATHLVEMPFTGEAKKIIQAAGLEKQYRDIAGEP
ncbi:MAG TPA: hypothetical protein VK815_08885 [Candidatus Acidoferrales bacterium]|nr:hypothetical protein [Candidatus Acidoferrales bacterium]